MTPNVLGRPGSPTKPDGAMPGYANATGTYVVSNALRSHGLRFIRDHTDVMAVLRDVIAIEVVPRVLLAVVCVAVHVAHAAAACGQDVVVPSG